MTRADAAPSLVRETFTVGPHAGSHRVAARAGLSVFVPLTVLVITGHVSCSAFAAFGAFTFLYGRSARYAERTALQISVAGVLVLAVTLGCAVGLLPHRQWWIVVVGAVLASVASLLSDAFHWHPPGPLFVVFAFTVSATGPPPGEQHRHRVRRRHGLCRLRGPRRAPGRAARAVDVHAGAVASSRDP